MSNINNFSIALEEARFVEIDHKLGGTQEIISQRGIPLYYESTPNIEYHILVTSESGTLPLLIRDDSVTEVKVLRNKFESGSVSTGYDQNDLMDN